MSRVKTMYATQQESLHDESLDELIMELRSFHDELSADNDDAEERDRERARQFISLWKI